MESKHTEGPWYYDTNDKINPDRSGGIVRDLGEDAAHEVGCEICTELIAEVCVSGALGQADADGRLIAAAPELLEALEHCREALSIRADYWANDPEQYGYLLDALDSSDAAIAKAKGEQP